MLVGAAFMFDIRLLGFSRNLPLWGMSRHLLPWSRRGLWLIIPSGILLFMTNAKSLSTDPTFWLKIVLIIVAAVNVFIFHRFIFKTDSGGQTELSPVSKVLAVVSIVVWIGVIACGRLLAYWTEVFVKNSRMRTINMPGSEPLLEYSVFQLVYESSTSLTFFSPIKFRISSNGFLRYCSTHSQINSFVLHGFYSLQWVRIGNRIMGQLIFLYQYAQDFKFIRDCRTFYNQFASVHRPALMHPCTHSLF